jgi:hypothetical protein
MVIGSLAVFCTGLVIAALYLWVVRGRLQVANTTLISTVTELQAGNLALTSTVTELKEMDAKSRLEADYKAKKGVGPGLQDQAGGSGKAVSGCVSHSH